MNKESFSADTVYVGGRRKRILPEYKEGLYGARTVPYSPSILHKKTARTFFAEIYRRGSIAGDSFKATLWHTQTSV